MMKDQATIEKEFTAELEALLKKYDAEIVLENTSRSFYSNHTIMVYIQGKWDENHNCVSEFTEIDLGTSV